MLTRVVHETQEAYASYKLKCSRTEAYAYNATMWQTLSLRQSSDASVVERVERFVQDLSLFCLVYRIKFPPLEVDVLDNQSVVLAWPTKSGKFSVVLDVVSALDRFFYKNHASSVFTRHGFFREHTRLQIMRTMLRMYT